MVSKGNFPCVAIDFSGAVRPGERRSHGLCHSSGRIETRRDTRGIGRHRPSDRSRGHRRFRGCDIDAPRKSRVHCQTWTGCVSALPRNVRLANRCPALEQLAASPRANRRGTRSTRRLTSPPVGSLELEVAHFLTNNLRGCECNSGYCSSSWCHHLLFCCREFAYGTCYFPKTAFSNAAHGAACVVLRLLFTSLLCSHTFACPCFGLCGARYLFA